MRATSFLLVVSLAASSHAAATVQGTCTTTDIGLAWLRSVLSPQSVISCKGQPLQLYNAGRYWGKQYGKDASVVVFPASTQDVAYTVQATSMTPLGLNFAFVSGAHGQTNASSSKDFVIDLSYMNKTTIVPNFATSSGSVVTAVCYEGGSTWDQVMGTTANSGYTAVGARVGSVGVGGFSTGGGIGFLAGAYGYAIDRLIQMEVVLTSGIVVIATKNNIYSDLFWALQGGGGQFGIVTRFWQEAAPEPQTTTIGIYYIADSEVDNAQHNTVTWFKTNSDPFSLCYYAIGFVPPNATATDPSTFALRTVLVALQFSDPTPKSKQNAFKPTFATLLAGLTPLSTTLASVPYSYATELLDPYFPYGFRRGFYGPQTTTITTAYLANITSTFNTYVTTLLATGAEFPATALWVLQYMFPGLNGNLPATPDATAWPHTVAGHQTLFSPAWLRAEDDGVTDAATARLNQITYDNQASVGGAVIPDYPNYISPGAKGSRVWGGNVGRLIDVKGKYDPLCRIHQGRVFGAAACVLGGWANVFAS